VKKVPKSMKTKIPWKIGGEIKFYPCKEKQRQRNVSQVNSIVMCYCIVIDLSYIMYNDSWRRNKSKSKSKSKKYPVFIITRCVNGMEVCCQLSHGI
jgi:uncharacterized glyoxalase superfamily protein PhnB